MKKTVLIIVLLIALVIAANLAKSPIINTLGKVGIGIILLISVLCVINIIKEKTKK